MSFLYSSSKHYFISILPAIDKFAVSDCRGEKERTMESVHVRATWTQIIDLALTSPGLLASAARLI